MAEKGQLSMMEVRFWQQEAQSCLDRQRIQLIERNNYPFLINYYEGVERIDPAYPHVSAKQRMAIINEFFPNTNSLISEIMYQNPDMLLEAMKPQAEEDLPLMRAAIKYLFDHTESLIENRVALFDMLYAGYSAVEIDILPKEERDELIDTAPEEELPNGIFDKVARSLKKAVTPEDVEKSLAKLSPPIEANYATVQGTYIRRYDPLDVPLDWRAERIRDRRYNLKKVWLSKAEFDAKYPKFKDLVHVEEQKFQHSRHELSLHTRKVLLFEFQARMKGNKYQTLIISPNVNTQEIDTFVRPYTTNGFNMKIGTLHKYGKAYPRAMAQINKTMQDELNNYVRFMMEVAERNIPKYVTDKNKVKGDAIEALRSNRVNDLVEVDGNTSGAVTPLQPTGASFENKELISIFQDQKNKLWSVSESRIQGNANPEFATELAIQEQGFKASNVDLQEGLRMLIVDEANTGKDLIVTFWDDEIFLKVTGSEKMDWYEPVPIPDPNDPSKTIIANPLAEVLTGDYLVNIDIASAARPNRDQQLQRMIFFMTQLAQVRPIMIEQGQDINVEEFKRISKEFGWNPDKLFVQYKPQQVPNVPTAGGETLSPEEDAIRQAEAESQVGNQ